MYSSKSTVKFNTFGTVPRVVIIIYCISDICSVIGIDQQSTGL